MKKFLIIFLLAFILISPAISVAQDSSPPSVAAPAEDPPAPVAENPCKLNPDPARRVADVPACISQVYRWSLGIAAILAMLMIVYGGYQVMTAAGNGEKSSEGKEAIFSAIVGMILLFAAYLILNTINPDLVQFRLGVCVKDGEVVYDANNRAIAKRQECQAAGGKIELFKPAPRPEPTTTPPPQE